MTLVVSDTSPIRALANLGLLGILHDLYGKVIVPQAVADELSHPVAGQITVDLDESPFVEVRAATDPALVRGFLESLDRGESEALALALEVAADLVLIDEAAGRSAAKRVGLSTTGVLGVLLDAKRSGLIVAVRPLLDQLQDEFRFYLSGPLRDEILRLAGETS